MLEKDLVGKLKEVTLVNNKFYPLIAPEGTIPPYLVYSKVSSSRGYTLSGYNGTSTARMQISCYAKSYLEVKNVAQQVIKTLELWSNAKNIQGAFNENEIDMYDEETQLYHTPVDFIIDYKEVI